MKIRRQSVTVDFFGRIFSHRIEELKEEEAGVIDERYVNAVCACQSCGRPVEKVQDIRGACVECGRLCCDKCEGRCSLCQRPVCGSCRQGFAARGLSVCSECVGRLEVRLAREDRLAEEATSFDRRMTVYGALAKLIQPDKPLVKGALGSLLHLVLVRKLAGMARELREARDDDRRRLP